MSKRLTVELTDQQASQFADWTDCAAFRITDLGDGTARLEPTNDLDRVTRPGPDECHHCNGTGKFVDPYGGESRCRYCAGTGRR